MRKKLTLITISKTSLKTFLVVILYRVFLDISYFYAISPLFSYAGMISDINIIKLIESYGVLFVMLFFLPKHGDRLSDMVLQLLILSAYVPLLTFYSLANQERIWFYYATFFWLFVILLNKTKLTISFKFLKEGKYLNWMIAVFLITTSLVALYLYFGFSFSINLNIFDEYEIYEIRKEHHLSKIPFGGYLINWTAKIILPFVILLALYKKKLVILSLAIFSEFILFSVTGHKSYLFIVPVAIGLYWLIGKGKFVINIGFVFSVIIAIGLLLYWFADDILFTSLLIRRIFIVPAQVSFYYYDFFKDNPIYLSHSIFKYLIEYPYDLNPPRMIGAMYFSNPETHANNGIVADSFMNFGFLGILLWSVLFVALLKLADNLVKLKNKEVTYPIMILNFYTLVNSGLLTTILTHGLFLVFIVSYFLEKEKNQWNLKKSVT